MSGRTRAREISRIEPKAELITVAELADWLRIGRVSARNLITSGQVEAAYVGKVLRINRASVDRLLDTPAGEPQREPWRDDPARGQSAGGH